MSLHVVCVGVWVDAEMMSGILTVCEVWAEEERQRYCSDVVEGSGRASTLVL